MSATKISALTALTGANVEQTADNLPIVDNSATTTKKILVSELAQAIFVAKTSQASTSGTSLDFTSIPSWVKRVTLLLYGVSLSGTANLLAQVGTSGGIVNTGYVGGVSQAGSTPNETTNSSGLLITVSSTAAVTHSGTIVFTLVDSSTNKWVGVSTVQRSDGYGQQGGTLIALSGALDRIRLASSNGSDTFDAGTVNVLYE